MNTIDNLLKHLEKMNVVLYIKHDKLLLEKPANQALNPDLLAQIKSAKNDILQILRNKLLDKISQEYNITRQELMSYAGEDWATIKDNPAAIEALANLIANQNTNHEQCTTVTQYSMPKVHAIDNLWNNFKDDPNYTNLAGLLTWRRKRIKGELPDNFTSRGICTFCGEIPIPIKLVKHSPLNGCMFCTIN